MATQEKLRKSLEALRNVTKSHLQSPDVAKKKEKIQHCYIITEAISNPTIRISTDFHILLGTTIEIFLRLCDDQDSDIRMTSEECLNRIIRAGNDGYIGKIQIELHKEIKKNGASKPLRTALWLFSILAHHIRPHKGKPYVANLFPSIIKIAERTEEPVHETLALSLPRIMNILGCFSTENEIKSLLKAFLANVASQSAVIRRTTSNCILTICMNCRKPYNFIIYCLNYLLESLVPVNETQNNNLILGVMSCTKILLPNLKNSYVNQEYSEQKWTANEVITEKFLQIYELCLYYLTNKDHNIINVCLETLNVLLQNSTEDVKEALLNEKGLGHCRIYSTQASKSNPRSPSQLSIATNVTTGEENLFSESELTETVRSDIEKWIDTSKLSVMNITFAKTKEKSLSLDKVNMCLTSEDIPNMCDYEVIDKLDDNCDNKIKSCSIGNNLDKLIASENSSEKSVSYAEDKILNVDIDVQEIDIGEYLDKNTQLLYCTRLITKLFLLSGKPQTCIPDKIVRVSVKSLALSCLSSIFLMYPSGFLANLDKHYTGHLKLTNKKNCSQQISDVLLFKTHSDPQLRGAVRTLTANFIGAILILSEGDYGKWVRDNVDVGSSVNFSIKELVQLFVEGLEDESANCIRQTLLSLNGLLKNLTESQNSVLIDPLINTLPLLSKNPYWLVKVALSELVSKIDYVTINYITESSEFQNKVIHNILFELLSDNDQRVRASAANSIVQIIPLLHFEDHQIRESAVTSKAIVQKNLFIKSFSDIKNELTSNKRHFIMNMPFPFNKLNSDGCDRIDFSLSKVIVRLYNIVLTATSKHLISGCIETLSVLSDTYPCTVYTNCWCSSTNSSETPKSLIPDLLSLCISLLTTSIHVYDLQFHLNILNLTANLYAGQSLPFLKPIVDEETKLWDMFTSDTFCTISEQYLTHVTKLLNIFHHVLNEMAPVPPQSKVLPNLPAASNLSPLKRRKSDLDKKVLLGKSEKDERTEKRESSKLTSVGSFVTYPHYLKIYEALKSSFMNYKISLESEGSKKFLELLNKTLQSLSVVMEIGTLKEFSRIAEDILGYLRSTFTVDPPSTVECVQQLLKSLFGTNLTSNITEFIKDSKSPSEKKEEDGFGFYFNIFQKPYSDISSFINSLNNINRYYCDGDSTVMGYLHRKDVKKRSVVFSRSSDKVLANYIRIFEPMVIKSLKQYTITSNVKLQCRVLQLLNQLVQLRVNYCLLDSEQVFIGFVLKQFEYIEEGQVPLPEQLIPKIFQFLVQLSYSKQHSKCIIGVPKIIQLCDGLMASGQPPLTHCIPALEPIVEDIFLTRNKSNTPDMKELETTREVLLSMLLRLSEYKQVLSLLTLVLEDSKYCIDNTEKWLGWSKQVLGVVLPMLKQNKIRLDTSDDFVVLKRFILALEPNVFKPFDEIIIMFFQEPPLLENNETSFNRWLSKILIILLILIPLKEDILLAKINRLKSEFSPNSIFEHAVTKADPLNVNNNADTFGKIPAELIFIRFIFRVASLTSKQCLEAVRGKGNDFLIEQFSSFLMHCLYIFQSGSHCKITNKCITILNKNIPFDENDVIQLKEINRNFLNLAMFYPILTFHWCYFLTLMNYCDKWFWSCVLRIEENSDHRLKDPSVNLQIMKIGGVISFCDYLSEDLAESDKLTWFLRNISELLVMLCNETPISEFITSIHRNTNLSKIFIENLSKNCSTVDCAIFKTKLLKCIENCHPSQIGPVLNLLVPNMLNYRQVALSRLAANVASRKIEFLLTLPMEDVNNQLSREDIVKIQKTLTSLQLVKKHETLVSLLNKLSVQFYDLSPLEFTQRRIVNPEYIKRLKINKKWYLSQIQGRYGESNVGKETAELLNHLEYSEIISFMSSSDFNKLCLRDCIKLGLKYFEGHMKEPAILKACADVLLKDITSIVTKIPTPHQVFCPVERNPSALEDKYMNELKQIFRLNEFSHLNYSIASCIPYYMNYLNLSPDLKIPDNNYEDFMKFGVICLEYVSFLINSTKNDFNINLVDTFLTAADGILKQTNICSLLATDINVSWFCSSVNSVFGFVKLLIKNDRPLPSIPKDSLKNTLGNDETLCAGEATYQLYVLVSWLYENKSLDLNVPIYFLKTVKSITINLSRFPLVNSFVLMPSRVLITGRVPEVSGTFNTQVPPLPIELLQEIDVLEEYIFRITLLGWTSRQQFEETWMCLLSVLCAPIDDIDPLEINDAVHASSLAMKAITTLLLETLKYPIAGHPNVSNLMHVSRDLPISEESIGIRKLRRVQKSIKDKYQEWSQSSVNFEIQSVFEGKNFEKLSTKYCYGQVSIKYFMLATGVTQEEEDNSLSATIFRKRSKMLEEAGLDVNSCLQFLLDYYTQLMKPQSSTNIRVLHEAVRSTVMISDLFTDKSQFAWMLEVFLELSKLHAVEDELLHQYLIVGICKAVSVLTPDLETYEQVKKMLVQYLKSPNLTSRIASIHGLLYILEGCKLSNITIGGISDEMQLLLPCAVEYVQFNMSMSNNVLKKSQEHTMILWSLAFYLIENIDEVHMEQNFVSNTLASAFLILNTKSTNQLHYSVIKGIERLLIVKKSYLLQKFGKQILKLALEKMKYDNPVVSLLGTQLLLSYMYTDCSDHLQNSQVSSNAQTSPDHLVQTIEKISAIFERIKRGYVFEVDILCSVIPSILDDFFSPSDILTKVIGEFLSPQQPHPQLLSKVVFQVFESAIQQEQLSLLQDWVVFSLSNFTQSFSIGMATWCLTCFFISASSNEWLRSYFPYIQTRVGRYEYEDKKLLCIAGADFFNTLPNETQKQKFVDNFNKVKDQPDTPFNDLLLSL